MPSERSPTGLGSTPTPSWSGGWRARPSWSSGSDGGIRTTDTIRLAETEPLNLEATLGCGQAFRWHRSGDVWDGVVGGHRIRLRQQGRTLRYSGVDEDFIRHYLALDLDLDRVLTAIDTDPVIGAAIEACHGLRILRQPLFECLVSYLCATNTNIPAVRSRVEALADHFGQRVGDGGIGSFPSPRALGSASEADLRVCRLGYRARYVRAATATVLAEPRWEDEVRALPHDAARDRLMALPGIGPKAADCILLFALDHLEAFPVDVWIHRIIGRHYRVGVDRTSMTPAVYERIRRFGQTRFGRYAGYAQEYLYGARSLLCSV